MMNVIEESSDDGLPFEIPGIDETPSEEPVEEPEIVEEEIEEKNEKTDKQTTLFSF